MITLIFLLFIGYLLVSFVKWLAPFVLLAYAIIAAIIIFAAMGSKKSGKWHDQILQINRFGKRVGFSSSFFLYTGEMVKSFCVHSDDTQPSGKKRLKLILWEEHKSVISFWCVSFLKHLSIRIFINEFYISI